MQICWHFSGRRIEIIIDSAKPDVASTCSLAAGIIHGVIAVIYWRRLHMNTLEFAINMELEGAKYYRGQAELKKTNGLGTVFLLLARDEDAHAQILQDRMNNLPCDLKDNQTLADARNVFNGIGDYKEETIALPRQIDLYRMALDKEKQSIDLYNGLLSEATDETDKQLFTYLLRQETTHYSIIEDIIMLVNRPEDWVEDAEFGIREEY